jgi:hypothetical protein
MIVISKKGQSGVLLEIFLLILILVLFLLFWNSFARITFLAGMLDIDDANFEYACSKMIQVVVGGNYIVNFKGGERTYEELVEYLDLKGTKQRVPDAKFFYERTIYRFPELENRLQVMVEPYGLSAKELSVFQGSAGISCSAAASALSLVGGGDWRCAVCEFPLYSTDEDLEATVRLGVLI